MLTPTGAVDIAALPQCDGPRSHVSTKVYLPTVQTWRSHPSEPWRRYSVLALALSTHPIILGGLQHQGPGYLLNSWSQAKSKDELEPIE